MTSNLSTLNRKWILGAVLGLVAVFLLAFGLGICSASSLEDYIDPESVEFYTDSSQRLRVHFKVNMTFDIDWATSSPITGECVPADWSWYLPYWVVRSENFDTGAGTFPHWAWFFQSLDMTKYADCVDVPTDFYLAGNSYDVFIADTQTNGFFFLDMLGFENGNPLKLIKDFPTCQNSFSCPYDETEYVYFQLDNVEYSADKFYWEIKPSIFIKYPPTNAEMSDTFTMEIDYFEATGYDQIIIWFEDWDIDDCPDFDEPDYQEKKDLYFNNQSKLFYSDYFYNATGTTFMEISDMETGNYNCNMCRFYNSITTAMSSRLCKGYIVKILEYIPPADLPDIVLPISKWTDYYAEYSERYTTSTPIFTSMAETFSPLITWVGNTILFFNNYFSPETAGNKGEEIGNAVRVARGYLESIDDFFGGLPISTIFIFYLITAILVIVYRLARGILTIIIP